MKLQKNIIILCIIMIAILGAAIFLLDKGHKIYDVCIGLFTGAFLTMLTTTVFYFHEKGKILNRTYNKFSEIYFGLCNLDKYLGEFLVLKEITDSKFNVNYGLANEIENIAYSFDFEEYSSFFAKNINIAITNLSNFKVKLSNLSRLTGDRTKNILNYEILQKDIEIKKMQGCNEQFLAPYIQKAAEQRDSILIQAAKLHEYATSLKLELDALLSSLDGSYNFNCKWDVKKKYFDAEINNTNNSNQAEDK